MTRRSSKTQSTACPIYLVAGTDPFLLDQQAQRLVNQFLSPDQKAMAFWQPPEDDLPDIAEIFDELRTLPFLANRRIILIKNAEAFISDNRAKLEKYLEEPSPTGILILLVGKSDNRTRLTKMIAKMGSVIEAGQIRSQELPKFASDYCQQHYEKTMPYKTSQMLIQFVGDDTGRICSEIEKLAIFVGSKKTITPEDVETLIGQNRIFNAFEVVNAIMTQKTEDALRRLRNMLNADKTTEYTVVGAFAYHFRRLFNAKALLEEGQTQQQASKKLGIPNFIQGRLFSQVRLFSLHQLGQVLAKLGQIDFLLKTGRTSAASAMERLVVQLGSLLAG